MKKLFLILSLSLPLSMQANNSTLPTHLKTEKKAECLITIAFVTALLASPTIISKIYPDSLKVDPSFHVNIGLITAYLSILAARESVDINFIEQIREKIEFKVLFDPYMAGTSTFLGALSAIAFKLAIDDINLGK